MAAETVHAVLARIDSLWGLADHAEITAEANPSSSETQKFAEFRHAGVNRLSIGVQSLRERGLKDLGRLHSVREALDAVNSAKSIFDNVSIDLIYGRQFQTLADWRDELREALALDSAHVSLYQLTIEPGTAFWERLNRQKLGGLPDDDIGVEMHLASREICKEFGFRQYEVSNYAKPGRECRHNLAYWRGLNYLGIGPGAHGRITIRGRRTATETHLSPSSWLNAIAQTGTGESRREYLDSRAQAEEYLLMAMRLNEGMSENRFASLNGRAPDRKRVAELVDMDFLTLNRGYISATAKGMPVLNTIIAELID